MARSRKQGAQDYTRVAFTVAAILGCAVVAAIEDMLHVTDDMPWKPWQLHPVSIFGGIMAFTGLLYLLQRMNDKHHAGEYLQPYLPLLALSCATVTLKVNVRWLLPAILVSIVCSVAQVRKFRRGRGHL
jgi:hypothetical protein